MRRLIEHRVLGGPAALGRGHLEAHAAVLGELEGVGEEVLEDLLQALLVGEEAAPELRIERDLEGEPAGLGVVAERPGHGVERGC